MLEPRNFNMYIEERETVFQYMERVEQETSMRAEEGTLSSYFVDKVVEAFEHSMMNERGLHLIRQIVAKYKEGVPTVQDLTYLREWVRYRLEVKVGIKRDEPYMPFWLKQSLSIERL